MSRLLVLVVVVSLVGCGGDGRSSDSVEEEVQTFIQDRLAGEQDATLSSIDCVKREGNEYECIADFATNTGTLRISGVATCEETCLWRTESASKL
jgi:hypothetical protein